MFRFIPREKIKNLPESAGVYCFKNQKGEFLYIGKASNIKERVKNHFQQPGFRSSLFVNQTAKIGYFKTNSEISALLLEADLIKKYQPKYNVMWRDDKNYFYVAITKEPLPVVFITHQIKESRIQNLESRIQYIGPFVDGTALKKTLRFLRKIFPYYTQKKHPQVLCPWCHLELCPGPEPDKKGYRDNIKNLVKVLRGKRNSVLKNLKKEMKIASYLKKYEKAGKIRDQIRALETVYANTRVIGAPSPDAEGVGAGGKTIWSEVEQNLKKLLKIKRGVSRIEAYDVSNIQGKEATGSMVIFINGEPNKNFYRKFKIRIEGKPNDVAMLKEVLSRRFSHPEWSLPDLILIDGGIAQLNVALNLKSQISLIPISSGLQGAKRLVRNLKSIKIMALAKKRNELFIEGKKSPVLLKTLPREIFNLILQLRDEAHRFARKYHLKLRIKSFVK